MTSYDCSGCIKINRLHQEPGKSGPSEQSVTPLPQESPQAMVVKTERVFKYSCLGKGSKRIGLLQNHGGSSGPKVTSMDYGAGQQQSGKEKAAREMNLSRSHPEKRRPGLGIGRWQVLTSVLGRAGKREGLQGACFPKCLVDWERKQSQKCSSPLCG